MADDLSITNDGPRVDMSDEQHADEILNYILTKRPAARGCIKVNRGVAKRCKCHCLDEIVRACRENEGGDHIVWRNYLLKWVPAYKAIYSDPQSQATFVKVCDLLHRTYLRPDVRDKTPALIADLPHTTIVMDWNGWFELGGHCFQHNCKVFYSAFITSHQRNDVNSIKFYYHSLVIPKQPKLQAFIHTCRVIAQQRHNMLFRNELMFHHLNKEQVIEDMRECGMYPKSDGIHMPPNEQSDRSKHIPDCLEFLRILRNSFILAHPQALPFPQPGPNITIVTDPAGNSVTADVFIKGCTGVFSHIDILGPHTIFPIITTKLLEAVGYDGRIRDGVCECLDHNHAGFSHLIQEIGVQDENNAADAFIAALKIAVLGLIPHEERQHTRVQFQFSGCVTPFPDPPYNQSRYVDSPSFPLQQTLQSLHQPNFSVFRGIVPLKEEGVFLQIFPQVQECNPDPARDRGKLVFVPQGSVYISPANLVFSDRIRTSLAGNPRLVFWAIVLPEANSQQPTIRYPVGSNGKLQITSPHRFVSDHIQTLDSLLGF
jgi:hypothetical protein